MSDSGSQGSHDRNLLVGVIALQMDLVTRDQLIAAMQGWILDKKQSIESIFEQQGFLQSSEREFLSGIANKHLELHGGDAERSLAALSSIGSVRNEVFDLHDDQLTQTLNGVAERKSASQETVLDEVSTDFSMSEYPRTGTRFRVLRPHAKGGLGVVSVAEDTELNRQVALKQIQSGISGDSISRARFLVEAEVTGRLEHPGVVPVYSLGVSSDGSPYYAMRFIQGDSLKQAIRSFHDGASKRSPQQKALQLRDLIKRLVDVCDAIEYAHSRGVLHRDLKPGNIMLGKYGETLVVDWGLARVQGKNYDGPLQEETLMPLSGDGSAQTRMGTTLGTIAYMSPEQAEGRLDSLGPRSDVYSLGATLYAILTGHAAVTGDPTESLQRVRTGDFPPARSVDSSVDPALSAVCAKAMKLKPEDRHESAAALGRELDLWLAGEPVQSYPEPLLKRMGRIVSRHQTKFAIASLFAVVLIGTLLLFQQMTLRQNKALAKKRDEQKKLIYQTMEAIQVGLRDGETLREVANGIYEDSVTELRRLHKEDPLQASIQQALAEGLRVLALRTLQQGKSSSSVGLMRESVQLQQQLLNDPRLSDQVDETERSKTVKQLVDSSIDFSRSLRYDNQYEEAREALSFTKALLDSFTVDDFGSDLEVLQATGKALSDTAMMCMDQEEWEDTLAFAEKSHDTYGQLFRLCRQREQSAPLTAISESFGAIEKLGAALRELGRLEDSEKAYQTGFQQLADQKTENPGLRSLSYWEARLIESHSKLVLRRDAPVSASDIERQRKAVSIFRQYAERADPSPMLFAFYGCARCTLGRLLAAVEQEALAVTEFKEMEPILERAIELSKSSDYAVILADNLKYRISFTDQATKSPFSREDDLEKAVAAANEAVDGSNSLPAMVKVRDDLIQQRLPSE